MKEVEYSKAVKANDQLNIDLIKAALRVLKEDLADSVKAFDSIPSDKPDSSTNDSKKTRRWQNLFSLKIVTNRKQ